jgi:hypothetical protein
MPPWQKWNDNRIPPDKTVFLQGVLLVPRPQDPLGLIKSF